MKIPVLRRGALQALLAAISVVAQTAQNPKADPRLHGAYTFHRAGWTFVHLEGTPE